jgi:hypothetical protein
MSDESERSRSNSSPLFSFKSFMGSPRTPKSSPQGSAKNIEIDPTKIAEQKLAMYQGLSKHVSNVNKGIKKGLITPEQADIMIKCYKSENGIIDK